MWTDAPGTVVEAFNVKLTRVPVLTSKRKPSTCVG
jgi:hypothetical protein